MSESFKQQGVPGEVPGVIREDCPSPLLGRPDDSIPPTGLSTLGVDGAGLEINVPPAESVDDLPLDSGSGHKGLHCPLPATESPDQSLGLSPGQPHFTRFVSLCGSYVSDWIVGNGFDFHQIVGEHGESRTIAHLRGTAYRQALQEERDVALGEVFRAESLSLGDHAPDLTDVLGIYIPCVYQGRDIYLLEAVNENGETVRFISNEQIRKGRSLQYNQFQRLPLESSLEGANHLLDCARRCVVRGSTSLAPATLVREVEAGFPDRAAFATEGHLDAGDAPADAPVSRARIYSWGVTLYPGRDSNSYSASAPRDFEGVSTLKGGNALPDSPSVTPSNRVEASVSESQERVPPQMPPDIEGWDELSERTLYFAYNSVTDLVKVGITRDLDARVRSLEFANGVPIELLGSLERGGRYEEALHGAFYNDRALGEWFRPSDELIELAVAPSFEGIEALIETYAETIREYRTAQTEKQSARRKRPPTVPPSHGVSQLSRVRRGE